MAIAAVTMAVVSSEAHTAQAAVFKYNYTGVVTQLYGGGELLPPDADLRGTKLGDLVSGSYTYDDSVLATGYSNSALLTEFTYRLESSNGETTFYTLNNFLGQATNGIVDLTTGDIVVGVNLAYNPNPIYGGISSEQGILYYGVRNTAVASTFETFPVFTATQSIPEASSTLALLVVGLSGLFSWHRVAKNMVNP